MADDENPPPSSEDDTGAGPSLTPQSGDEVHSERAAEKVKAALTARLRDISNSDWAKRMVERAQTFDWSAASEGVTRAFQKRGGSFYGKLGTLILCTFFLSDILALYVGSRIPEPAPARGGAGFGTHKRQKAVDEYNVVFTRNLFNSKGLIPGDEVPTNGGFQDQGGAAVRTTLPMALVGTVILENDHLSVAMIEDKSASTVYPVRIDDEIPAKIRILTVEPRKVVFINMASGRREFVDLPEEPDTGGTKIAVAAPSGPGVEQLSATQFNVSRQEVDKAIGNLSQVLTQARAIPNFKNGVPSGYKLIQIVPDSIYSKLGLKDGDVLNGLNGEPINDPAKAFAMLQALRDMSHLELGVERDGRQATYAYDIR